MLFCNSFLNSLRSKLTFLSIFLLNSSEFRNEIKDKIRNELNDGLNNEHLLSEEDRILFYKLYIKLQKEFQDLDKDKLKD